MFDFAVRRMNDHARFARAADLLFAGRGVDTAAEEVPARDDFGRALDDFDAALKLDQHFPMALFARGYLLRQSKDSRFSEFDMTEAVRRQPGILQRAKELGFGAE